MFGIGLGEILLVVLITFLVSPRQIPKVMKKVGEFLHGLGQIKNQLLEIRDDVEEVVKDADFGDDHEEGNKESVFRIRRRRTSRRKAK